MTSVAPAGPTLPTIDLAPWDDGGPAARRAIADAMDEAGRTLGFLQVVGHGIPDEVVDGLRSAIDGFFALPAETKAEVRPPRPSINRGWTPPRSERLASSLGVASPDDLFEAFNIGAARSDFPAATHPGLADRLDPEIYAENLWPAGLPGFRDAVETWFRHAGAVARRLTSVFALALDLEPDHFVPFTDHSIDVLRLNHYPLPAATDAEPAALEPEQQAMGAHTDYGIVTVLWADPVPGLEVLRPDGTWLPVVPAEGALLVNLGDLTERWTNDRWTSTLHRVVPPRDGDGRLIRRRSAAYFHDGNADAVIATLPTCRTGSTTATDGGSRYPDVTVAEHLAEKLAGSRALELNPNAVREAARFTAARSDGVPTTGPTDAGPSSGGSAGGGPAGDPGPEG